MSCTFELTVDLHARGAVVEEAGVVVVAIAVDAVELRLRRALLRVVGRQLDSRFRLIARLRARLDRLDVVLRDVGSLVAIFRRRAVRRRGGLALRVRGYLLLAAVLQLGAALVLAGERRVVRASGTRHLSFASPKATEPSPADNARPVSSVMRLASVTKLPGSCGAVSVEFRPGVFCKFVGCAALGARCARPIAVRILISRLSERSVRFSFGSFTENNNIAKAPG